MNSLLQKSAIPLISSFVLLVAVILKLLRVNSAVVGILGFAALIVLLVSSFKNVFLSNEFVNKD
jgi:uncharacterized SAM-binding protein YcdF (DUF218 family)